MGSEIHSIRQNREKKRLKKIESEIKKLNPNGIRDSDLDEEQEGADDYDGRSGANNDRYNE